MFFNLKEMKMVTKTQAEFNCPADLFFWLSDIKYPKILTSVLIFYFHQSNFTKDILHQLFLGLLSYLFFWS